MSNYIITMKSGDIVGLLDDRARGNMYRFLSSVYLGPPSEDLLHYIAANSTIDELSSLFGEEAVEGLRGFAANVNIDKDIVFLKQEFMDILTVPTGRYVTPFEDVYRGNTVDGKQIRGPLLGECAVKVKRMYRQVGAEMEKTCNELPTHIGVELSFMFFLCEMQVEAATKDEGDWLQVQEKRNNTNYAKYCEIQIKFLREHLNKWFPQLSQSIQTNSRSLFYRSMAAITEEFLDQDAAFLLAKVNLEK